MLGVEGRENNNAMLSELSTQSLEQQKLAHAALQHPDVMHQMMKDPQTYLTALSGGNEEVIQAMTGSQTKADAMLAAARNPDRTKNAKPGDWNCPNCGDLVFASKAWCRCGTSKALAIQMGTASTEGQEIGHVRLASSVIFLQQKYAKAAMQSVPQGLNVQI